MSILYRCDICGKDIETTSSSTMPTGMKRVSVTFSGLGENREISGLFFHTCSDCLDRIELGSKSTKASRDKMLDAMREQIMRSFGKGGTMPTGLVQVAGRLVDPEMFYVDNEPNDTPPAERKRARRTPISLMPKEETAGDDDPREHVYTQDIVVDENGYEIVRTVDVDTGAVTYTRRGSARTTETIDNPLDDYEELPF